MLISMIIAGGFSFLISISIARSVDPEEFGVYSIIVNIQTVVALLAGLGMGTALAKFVAEYKRTDPVEALRISRIAIGLMMACSTACVVVYLALAGVIGEGLYNTPEIVRLIPLSALVVFSSASFTTIYGLVQGCQHFNLLAAMQIATPVVTLGLVVILVPSAGIAGALVAYAGGQGLLSLLALYQIEKSDLPFLRTQTPKADERLARKLVSFAIPAVLASLLVGPIIWISTTELALVSGFEEVGYFAVAMVFFNVFTTIPRAIVVPLIPRVAESETASLTEVENVTSKSIRATSFVMFPILFGVALFSGLAVSILYGGNYEPATKVIFLMMIACYLSALTSVIGGMITGIGRMWTGLALNIAWAAVFLVLTFLLVPERGTEGLGYAFAVSYGFLTVLSLMVSSRSFRVDLWKSFRIAGAGSAMFAAGFVIEMNWGLDYIEKTAILAAATALICILGMDELRMIWTRMGLTKNETI